MENEVFEIVTEYLTNERLSRIIAEDEEYKAALIHEQEVYSKLDVTLSDEQRKLMDRLEKHRAKRRQILKELLTSKE